VYNNFAKLIQGGIFLVVDKNIHFEVTDFKGRVIICEESTWNDHIVGGPNHPYMEGNEQEVIDALQNPEYGFRCHDRAYKNCRIYYKLSNTKDYFTKVIVEYVDDQCNAMALAKY
jgi:hypothetical protein